MTSTRTNPADWQKTLTIALFSLALGLAGCGFVVYVGWSEHQNKGAVDSNALTAMSIIGLGALMFLTFGVILLPAGLRERRQQQTIQSATTQEVKVASEGERGWVPGAGVSGHGGRALTPEGDYFVAPPPEIGEVISAYTSLRRGIQSRGLGVSVLAALALGAAGFLLGWLVMSFLEPKDATAAPTVGVFLGLLGAMIGWGLTRFKHACSYVGKEGVARFVCTYNRQRLTQREVFLFPDATDLRSSETRRYQNGVYRDTLFRFDWIDTAGQVRFQITGRYRGSVEGQNPWTHMPYQWACAAETAWSLYRLDHLPDELERQGSVRFKLDGADWLAVGPRFLDIHRQGETIHCTPEDIEEFALAAGVFTLRLRGGREGFFRSSGVCTFGYGEVANVKLFLLILDRLLGIAFS